MPIYRLNEIAPQLPEAGTFWVAPDAVLIGNIAMEVDSSVWFGAVLRGDNELIRIGQGSNIQDRCVLHTDLGCPLTVGVNCTVGHCVILHGCTIGDNSLIGMGATILNRATIGRNCLIGAGALIPEGKTIPDNSLVIGSPGRVSRELGEDDVKRLTQSAEIYQANWRKFAGSLSIVE